VKKAVRKKRKKVAKRDEGMTLCEMLEHILKTFSHDRFLAEQDTLWFMLADLLHIADRRCLNFPKALWYAESAYKKEKENGK
jgi:hypothetical protein